MKLHAQVCWFDEPAENFERLAESLVGLCDSVLLFDGAYADYPHEHPMSSAEQCDDASRAFASRGIGVIMSSQDKWKPWPSQIAKRTAMWQTMLLNTSLQPGDYTLIIDADEHVNLSCPPQSILRALQTHQPDTALVALNTPTTDSYDRSLRGTHSPANSTSRHGRGVPRIMHLAHDMTIGSVHHGAYAATNRAGTQRVRYKARGGDHAHLPMAKSLDLSHLVEIRNETWSRSAERLRAKHAYGLRRRARGIDL